MANKPSFNHLLQESSKTLKKPQKSNLERNFKHMTIVYDSNYFKTIIYTKSCRVPSFVTNEPSLNTFKRESAKNVLKS